MASREEATDEDVYSGPSFDVSKHLGIVKSYWTHSGRCCGTKAVLVTKDPAASPSLAEATASTAVIRKKDNSDVPDARLRSLPSEILLFGFESDSESTF